MVRSLLFRVSREILYPMEILGKSRARDYPFSRMLWDMAISISSSMLSSLRKENSPRLK